MLYVNCKGGLTSRLDVVCSIVISPHYPDNITMVWDKGDGIMADFGDLFKNDLKFITSKDVDFSKVKIVPEQCGELIRPTEMSDMYMACDWPLRVEGINYVNWSPTNSETQYDNFLKTLQPVDELSEVINRYEEKVFGGRRVFGMNIRRGVGINYHPHSSIFSPTWLFIEKAKHIANSGFYTFLTTDSAHDMDLMGIHSRNILMVKEYMKYPMDGGYTVAGMKRTVIDWFLLSKCEYIYMGQNTGFAHRICRVYSLPYQELTYADDVIHNYWYTSLRARENGLFI